VESLNRHSKLYGNDPANAGAQAQRGQRVFCSDRGQRGGCGRTFAIFLAEVLPGHTVRAAHLWSVCRQLSPGGSIKAAVEAARPALALETIYHLLARVRRRLDVLRSCLCRRAPAPRSDQREPLLQTLEHLRSVAKEGVCPVSEFQVFFQQPFMG
jgi:hypothetical protein